MSQPEDFDAIPILLEPVAETPPADRQRVLLRTDQQSLFDDPVPPPAPVRQATPRRTPAQSRQAAIDELARRAPLLLEQVLARESPRIAGLLRERLQAELEQILRELGSDGR